MLNRCERGKLYAVSVRHTVGIICGLQKPYVLPLFVPKIEKESWTSLISNKTPY